MDTISIIVPTFNRKAMLQRLLASFSRLRCKTPLEIIIVDDCSNDGTREMVEDWQKTAGCERVIYHRLSRQFGPARARNAGIRLSTGNIIAFTDSDCSVNPLWPDHLHRKLTSSTVYAGVGGSVLPARDDIWSLYNTVYRILEPPAHLNALIGANCMFWKQPVVDAGMFDEYFIHPGGEEIALCMKLWLQGYRFGFEEQAIVYHDYRQTLGEFIRTFYHYGIGERILYQNRLRDYLRYIPYPEKLHNHLAFRNYLAFWMIFILHVLIGTINQRTFLGTLPVSGRKKIQLCGLHLLHHFSYHLGRGTFSKTLVREVRKHGAETPDQILDPESPERALL